MTTYFTSDQHFGHSRIIEFCGRPFDNVEEMDEKMIRRWNERVSPGDEVYCLGDFSFSSVKRTTAILEALNGTKYLVRGNHDQRTKTAYLRAGFSWVGDKLVEIIDGRPVSMRHYPLYAISDFCECCVKLCGHVHEKWQRHAAGIINVGVDVWDFYPRRLDELLVAQVEQPGPPTNP